MGLRFAFSHLEIRLIFLIHYEEFDAVSNRPHTKLVNLLIFHFLTVENMRWRALPERFGHWNSVWKRFNRLSKAGVCEAFSTRSPT
jgi:transposase